MTEVQRSEPGTVPTHSVFVGGQPTVDEVLIAPVKTRLRLRDLRRNAAVIQVLATRDFKAKYKQSLLGPVWLLIQPLALLAAFVIAFSRVADVESAGASYVVFALVGLAAWSFFQASLTIGAASVLSNQILVKLTPCPRIAFPIAGIIATVPLLVVTVAAAFGAAAIDGSLSWRVVLMPLGIAWLLLLTAGSVGLLSAVSVRFRDVLNAMPFLLQVGVFLSPVGYSIAQLDDELGLLMAVNPLAGLIETWRWMVLDGATLQVPALAISLATTSGLVVAGWRCFVLLEPTMADDI